MATFRYPSEPPYDAESKLCTHLLVVQPTRELQHDFTLIMSLPKLAKLTAPNFRLKKDNMTDESPLASALAPCCFPPLLGVLTSVIWLSDGCGEFLKLSPLLANLVMPKVSQFGVEWRAAPRTALRLGSAVSGGHRPKLVTKFQHCYWSDVTHVKSLLFNRPSFMSHW